MTRRIRVVGGPWPERHGCEGSEVTDPGDGIYPFDHWTREKRTNVIVLLDDDPINATRSMRVRDKMVERGWTCCLKRTDVEYL